MKLTKEHINYIEAYLKKNKVKYWDIRFELLDHIATDVEQRMQSGLDFEEALKQVHVSFGNKYKTKRLNAERTDWVFTESLYADNSGFKKLIMQKQKELNRNFRKTFGVQLLRLFRNPVFLIVYALIIWGIFKVVSIGLDPNMMKKSLLLLLLIIILLPYAWVFKTYLIDRKKSLYLELLNIFQLFFLGIFNIITATGIEQNWIYFVLILIAIPLIVASFISTRRHLITYETFYRKWRAPN